jgi:hypothetical protein
MGTLGKTTATILCALICGCQTTSTERRGSAEQSTSSTFVHSFTRFSFPEFVGMFHRVNVQKYDQQGRDVGVGYNSPTPIAATVFVYPGPKNLALLPSPKLENVSEALLDSHFQTCKQDVLRHHPDARFIREGPCKIVQGKHQMEGKQAVFSMSYKFGFTSQDSVSELYVFLIEPSVMFLVNDRQFVKYRVTYPVAKKAPAESEVAAFMSDLAWPTK